LPSRSGPAAAYVQSL